jgi:hypothetical protein
MNAWGVSVFKLQQKLSFSRLRERGKSQGENRRLSGIDRQNHPQVRGVSRAQQAKTGSSFSEAATGSAAAQSETPR